MSAPDQARDDAELDAVEGAKTVRAPDRNGEKPWWQRRSIDTSAELDDAIRTLVYEELSTEAGTLEYLKTFGVDNARATVAIRRLLKSGVLKKGPRGLLFLDGDLNLDLASEYGLAEATTQLEVLIAAARHLLHDHDCGMDGYERIGQAIEAFDDSDMVLVSREALRIVRNSEGPLYRQMWAKGHVDNALKGTTDAAR